MALNLRQIEVFRAVITTGSISGAAQLLHVSQAAVSRLLSHTELRVGFALFERIKGRLHATPEARKLFREVESVYAGVQRINDLVRDLRDNREGILNVVSSPSVGQMVIPQAVTAFRARSPNVKITFQFLAYAPLIERLLDHRADLAVTILPVDHPNLVSTVIGQAQLVCICPWDHPLTRRSTLSVADLQAWPVIAYDRETPFGRLVGGVFERAGQTLRAAVEVGSPQNACSMVHAGAGIALVDEFSVSSWPSNAVVTRPVHDAPTLRANLVHLRTEPLSRPAQDFARSLATVMRDKGFAPDETPIA